jgi:hypothetical protein
MVILPAMLNSYSKDGMTATARVIYKQKGENVSEKQLTH